MFTKNQIPRFIAAFSAPETEEGIYWIDLSSDPTGKIIRTHNGVEWVIIGRTGEDIDLSKFVVDANYVHSDFNFNQAYKAAIDAIPTYVSNRLSGYVSDPNYRHIDNNYTNEEKAKLANIEAGAQANDTNTVIDGNYVHTDYNFSSWYKAQVDKMPELSASNDLKADKIPAKPDIIWSPRVVDIPAGRVLSFNTNLKPAIFPDNITNYPAIRAFKVDYNGEDYVYFGLYRQSAQDVSHLGLFRVDGNTINVIRDLYNEVDG
jgi:hypothetical protein